MKFKYLVIIISSIFLLSACDSSDSPDSNKQIELPKTEVPSPLKPTAPLC